MLDGKLHLAPINEHPQSVLDVATGSGIWAMDFGERTSLSVEGDKNKVLVLMTIPADRYPSAYVIANDLSPTQPHLYLTPAPFVSVVKEWLTFLGLIESRRTYNSRSMTPTIPGPIAANLTSFTVDNIIAPSQSAPFSVKVSCE